jgi:hypothetical protein
MAKVGTVSKFDILKYFDVVDIKWDRTIDDSDVFIYTANLPSFSKDIKALQYCIKSTDYDGNSDITDKNVIELFPTNGYEDCYDQDNEANLKLDIMSIDLKNYSSDVEFSLSAPAVNKSSFFDYNFVISPRHGIGPDKSPLEHDLNLEKNEVKYGGYLKGISVENDRIENNFNFLLESGYSESECSNTQSIQNWNKTGSDRTSVLIQGDPSLFPFDRYHINLILGIPYKNIQFNLTSSQSTLSGTGFDYSVQTILQKNTTSQIDNLIRKNIGFATYPCHFEFPVLMPLCNIPENNYTSTNIKVELFRDYSIAIVVIPLLAIFFLLGAIFIFDNSSDNISNRLTLTLGVFALIFTLPEVINSMKPATSGPTIADSMLSIIIIATIAFTISSVISSSSIIRNWFPNRYTWIDGIVFLIVSGLVVAYFSNFPFDITIWLIPIIVFGLGYGLLLRILGVKITKPIFAKRKKTTIPKV